MILLFIKTTLKFFIKEEYPRWYGFILEILATLLLLIMLWFTSKAYIPHNLNQTGYFQYLLIGELVLHLPFSLLFQGVKVMKRLGLSGGVDQLLVADKSVFKFAWSFLFVYFFKGFLRLALLLLISQLLFELPFEGAKMGTFIVTLAASFIPFSLLSLAIGSVVLFWGRGENIWGQISSWLSLLSGAYFPLSIFPMDLHKILPFINPFALFLEISRGVLGTKDYVISSGEFLAIGIWISLFTAMAAIFFNLGLKQYKRRGPPASYSL